MRIVNKNRVPLVMDTDMGKLPEIDNFAVEMYEDVWTENGKSEVIYLNEHSGIPVLHECVGHPEDDYWYYPLIGSDVIKEPDDIIDYSEWIKLREERSKAIRGL